MIKNGSKNFFKNLMRFGRLTRVFDLSNGEQDTPF